jgi:pimeloyl-ACP methyl ester carboxylesterase
LLTEIQYSKPLEVVCVDLPGHGKSSFKPFSFYSSIDYVAGFFLLSNSKDVYQIVSALEWQDGFVALGHSMGAGILQAYASAFHSHVKKLIMIDAVGFFTSPPQNTTDSLR